MKMRKILVSALIFSSLLSVTAFPADANHGAVVNRNGLWADGFAYTSWIDRILQKLK